MNNFSWICTWKITHRCNLSCAYCDHSAMTPAGSAENIDYVKICETIEKLAPKIVNISGGEPTLVMQLPDIVQRLKKSINPFIRIVHNGTQPRKAVSLFPHIDRFVVSMDGPGKVNAATRGIDGNAVIERLSEILADAAAHNVELAINTVVTKHNAGHIREFAEKIRAVSQSILLSLTPVMPPRGEQSILNNAEMHAQFLRTYAELKLAGYNIMHTFDSLERHADFSCIQCYNQYFVVRVTPEGRVSACPMNVPLRLAASHVPASKLMSFKGAAKAFKASARMLKAKFSTAIDFSCTEICTCESWMDMLFLGKDCESADVYLRGLHGRLSDKDCSELDKFVRTHINPDFSISRFRERVELSGKKHE